MMRNKVYQPHQGERDDVVHKININQNHLLIKIRNNFVERLVYVHDVCNVSTGIGHHALGYGIKILQNYI